MWLLGFNGLDIETCLYKATLVKHPNNSNKNDYSLYSFFLVSFRSFTLYYCYSEIPMKFLPQHVIKHVALAWEQDPIPEGIILFDFLILSPIYYLLIFFFSIWNYEKKIQIETGMAEP